MTANPQSACLQGKVILITRPKHQAQALATLIEQQGGIALSLPMIVIQPSEYASQIAQAFSKLSDKPTKPIFIVTSANAVSAISEHWSSLAITPIMIAIGQGTATALQNAGITVDQLPSHASSEGLLELNCLQHVKAQSIYIFCGENPRPLLKETLAARGANVHLLFCYRRQSPYYSSQQLTTVLRQSNSVVCTSLEGLQNLIQLLDQQTTALLQQQQLVVISVAMQAYAKQHGLSTTLADTTSDTAILHALCKTQHIF